MTFQRPPLRVAPLLVLLAAAGLVGASPTPARAEEPIVIGMTYSAGPDAERSYRSVDGVKAYIERVNAAGGVHGRKLSLVALDSQGLPELQDKNLRTLVRQHHAVALLGCTGDVFCTISAQVASEMKVPLIAPMSGHSALSRLTHPYVFRLRADYAMESAAIAAQLTRLGCRSVAILSDNPDNAEVDTVLRDTLTRQGLAAELVHIAAKLPDGIQAAVKRMSSFHAVMMNLSAPSLEALVNLNLTENIALWPPVLMTLSIGNQSLLMRSFQGRAIGFSQVVPNPEVMAQPLARELLRDSERSGPLAVTFEGMEGYLGARLLVEGLRYGGRTVSPEGLQNALAARESWSLDGFTVSFAPGRVTGSTKVEIGMRSRSGVLMN